MCGVSAIIKDRRSTLSKSSVDAFNKCIGHRGPDGWGSKFFFEDQTSANGEWSVGLAHQRLSIIDLSKNGSQPMSLLSHDLWISFNGEIYNYLELKQELLSKGHSFRNSTDTEVILAAYREWGIASFKKLRGMWGFLLYDVRKKKIIACRDRMGIKPLYYYRTERYVAFASEIKQFLQISDFAPAVNKGVVKQYLASGFERTDRTFFKDVTPVLPGTSIEVDVHSLAISDPHSFWEPHRITPSIKDHREASEVFRKELHESVQLHLRSDVPVGCQLSGGVDSSSIFALMQEYYTGNSIHSFTVQFPGYEKDETKFVERMLQSSRTVPHFTTPNPDGFTTELENFIWHHDEPVGSFAHYAGFVLARLISENNIKVVLNGQGGDEILGGYWQQYYTYLFSLGKSFRVGALLSQVAGSLGSRGNEQMLTQLPAMLRRYRARNNRRTLAFTRDFEDVSSLNFYGEYLSLSQQERRVFEIRNLILPRLLKWDDRNLMAFGVEGRYPFLDHQVIESALSFDSSVLFKNGWTKYPLRMAMKDRIPPEIYFRKSKWGFETPQQGWLGNALKPMLATWIASDKPLDGIVRHEHTASLMNEFWKRGSLEDAQLVLRLFLLDKWLRVFSLRL